MSKKAIELTQVTIHDASSAEIRAYAEEYCGLVFDDDAAREYMLNAVIDSNDWLRPEPSEGATHVEVTVHKEEGQVGAMPYQGGANGKMFSIKRGERVIIPVEYYWAIKSANDRPGFKIRSLDDNGDGSTEESPHEERIPKSGTPLTIHRFITKAKASAA